MKKSETNYYKLFYTLSLILVTIFSLNTSFAANISDLQSQQSELDKQIEEGRSKVKETNSEILTIEEEISVIDNDIYAAEEKIYQTESDIEGKKNEIVNTEETIKQKQIELDNEKENQAETIRTVYESYKYTNPLRMIIGSSTLTQLLNYNAYLEALNDKIDASISEVNKIKKELEDKKSALEEDQRNLVALEEQQRAYKRGLDEQKSTKDNLLASKESEKASLESQIEEFKATQAEVQAQIAAAIAASRQSSGISAKDKGVSSVGFMWPTSGDITATFIPENAKACGSIFWLMYARAAAASSCPFPDRSNRTPSRKPLYSPANTISSFASMSLPQHFHATCLLMLNPHFFPCGNAAPSKPSYRRRLQVPG